jgi:hypothetical protein
MVVTSKRGMDFLHNKTLCSSTWLASVLAADLAIRCISAGFDNPAGASWKTDPGDLE